MKKTFWFGSKRLKKVEFLPQNWNILDIQDVLLSSSLDSFLDSHEGNESVTDCNQLKLKSPKDGKRYKTDVATTEQLLRLIQSIPSKKAEPFKMWLAQVGRERIEETIDPELSIDRALETYARLGYPDDWINQRQ